MRGVDRVGRSIRDDHMDAVGEFEHELARAADPHIEQEALDVLEHLLAALRVVRLVAYVGRERLARIDEQPDCARA